MSDIERPFEAHERVKKPFLELPQCEPVDKDVYENNHEVLEHISSLRERYETEMRDERSTEYDKKTEMRYLVYTYADSDVEKVSFKECPEIALLTLMEEAVEKHPMLLQEDNLVDLFWERSKTEKDFEDLHSRLEIDFHERLVIRSYMEQIAKLPGYNRKDSLLLNKIIEDLEQENESLVSRVQVVNDDSELEITQILPRSETATTLYDQGQEKGRNKVESNPQDEKRKKSRIGIKIGGGAVASVLLLAACASASGLLDGETDESLYRNEVITVPTTLEEITPTTSTLPPTTTSTTILPAIAPVETAPTETIPVETVPAETAPPETAPPVTEPAPVETAPPETTPPTTTVPTSSHDGFLSQTECEQLGGSPHPFELGETLIEYLITLGLTPEQANRVSRSEELMTKFKLEDVTASTVGLTAAECVPLWPAMKHIFASNT